MVIEQAARYVTVVGLWLKQIGMVETGVARHWMPLYWTPPYAPDLAIR